MNSTKGQGHIKDGLAQIWIWGIIPTIFWKWLSTKVLLPAGEPGSYLTATKWQGCMLFSGFSDKMFSLKKEKRVHWLNILWFFWDKWKEQTVINENVSFTIWAQNKHPLAAIFKVLGFKEEVLFKTKITRLPN